MNLFCFTLDGSTDSLYEPAQIGQNSQDFLPRRLPSPNSVKIMGMWSGSEPCITMKLPETHTSKAQESKTLEKAKRKSQILPTSEDETTDHAESDAHWPSTRKKDGLVHSNNYLNTEMVKDHRSKLTREEEEERVTSEKTSVQGVNFEAWNPNRENSQCRQQYWSRRSEGEDEAQGTLKKIQKLVGVKKGCQSTTEEARNNTEPGESSGKDHSPVITCISLTKKAEKKHTRASTRQSQQPLQDKDDNTETEGSWSPGLFQEYWSTMAYSPTWDMSTHTCHKSTAEQVMYNFNFTLPRDTDWGKYEELFQRLDPYKREQQERWITHSVMDLDMPDPLVRH